MNCPKNKLILRYKHCESAEFKSVSAFNVQTGDILFCSNGVLYVFFYNMFWVRINFLAGFNVFFVFSNTKKYFAKCSKSYLSEHIYCLKLQNDNMLVIK